MKFSTVFELKEKKRRAKNQGSARSKKVIYPPNPKRDFVGLTPPQDVAELVVEVIQI